ncbi:MAG: hypothetical protein AABW48_00715 [Nanoarchaeota archaeon]
MGSLKMWVSLNFSLGIVALLLVLILIGINLPTLGQAQYFFDKESPVCAVNWKEEFTLWNDLDRCCLEARKQLGCHKETFQEFDWVCQSGVNLKYWMNNKAYNYCRQLSIW